MGPAIGLVRMHVVLLLLQVTYRLVTQEPTFAEHSFFSALTKKLQIAYYQARLMIRYITGQTET